MTLLNGSSVLNLPFPLLYAVTRFSPGQLHCCVSAVCHLDTEFLNICKHHFINQLGQETYLYP